MIKKAELHVHLEGTISPTLAKKLAERNHIHLPANLIAPDGKAYIFKDFMDFLKTYDIVAGLIKKPEDYYDVTFDYLRSNALAGAIYIEMMYSPDHAEKSSGIPSSRHLEAIQQAIDDAEAEFGILGRIIITAVRHFGAEAAVKVATRGIKEKQPCIVGFGLGGDEAGFPPKLFKRAYDIAYEGGLKCTIHAGEFANAESIIDAIDHLPIQRIGHGILAIHSPEAIARLIDKNIMLEVCPSSNIALGLFPDLKHHPLIPLMEAGITVCLNSDDPPFFSTNLAEEYERVQQFHQFSEQQMKVFTQNAIHGAFVDDVTKEGLQLTLGQ